MTGLIKIAVIGILGALAAVALKKNGEEMALTLTLAVVAVLLSFTLSAMESVMDFFHRMEELAGLSSSLILPVVKTVGIAIVTKIAADICRDAKETAIASAVELAGVVIALYLTLPLLSAVVNMVTSLV